MKGNYIKPIIEVPLYYDRDQEIEGLQGHLNY